MPSLKLEEPYGVFLNFHLRMKHTISDNFVEVLKSEGNVR